MSISNTGGIAPYICVEELTGGFRRQVSLSNSALDPFIAYVAQKGAGPPKAVYKWNEGPLPVFMRST